MPTRRRSRTSTDPSTPQPDTSTGTSPEEQPAPEPEEAPNKAEGPEPEPTDEEWAKAREELLASLPPEDQRPKNIYGRLAQINSFIHQIRKTGWNAYHKYPYVKEANLVEAVRPILAAYGIWFEQGLHWDAELGIVGHQRLTKTARDKDRNIIGTTEDLTAVTLHTRFLWWNPDGLALEVVQGIIDGNLTPENVESYGLRGRLESTEWQLWAGYGDDAGDKGIYKALTGAEKYALMKTFLVSTGDDPEGDENTDKRAAARQAAGPVTVNRGGQRGRRAPAPGGRQAENTQAQRSELRELLVAANLTTAQPIVEKLNEILEVKIKVTDDDYAGALTAFMAQAPGTAYGLIIRKLREEQGTTEDVSTDADNGTEGAAVEQADEVDRTEAAEDGVLDDAAV